MRETTTAIPSWTLDEVLALGPCGTYARDRLLELANGRDRVDVLDVLDLPIPLQDKTWLIFREDVVPAPVLRLIACSVVRETPLSDGRKVWDLLADDRSRNAVEVAERHTQGQATDEELSAARSAAESAAWSAARSAWSAARSAAWSAAESAAESAWSAAWSAAESAESAWSAARSAQLAIVKRVLAEELGWSR